MLTQGERRGLKNVASAILNSGLKDARRLDYAKELKAFADSEWCESLCSIVGIAWVAYKRRLAELICITVERSKPKRIRTYELVEALRDGKDTGKHKSQEP